MRTWPVMMQRTHLQESTQNNLKFIRVLAAFAIITTYSYVLTDRAENDCQNPYLEWCYLN